jgi:hypothetical protein
MVLRSWRTAAFGLMAALSALACGSVSQARSYVHLAGYAIACPALADARKMAQFASDQDAARTQFLDRGRCQELSYGRFTVDATSQDFSCIHTMGQRGCLWVKSRALEQEIFDDGAF